MAHAEVNVATLQTAAKSALIAMRKRDAGLTKTIAATERLECLIALCKCAGSDRIVTLAGEDAVLVADHWSERQPAVQGSDSPAAAGSMELKKAVG